MTKFEMAEILCSSPAWDGHKNPKIVAKILSKDELKDYLNELEEREEEYYNYIYG